MKEGSAVFARLNMVKQLAIKPEKCIDCRTCTLVCSMGHFWKFDPSLSAVTVIDFAQDRVAVPVMCLQCDEAVCEKVCPTKALSRNENGAVVRDENRCIVCKYCVQACPTGMMIYAPSANALIKCDLCSGDPLCATWCPTKAIEFIEPSDNIDRRVAVAQGLADAIEAEKQ